MNWKHGYYADAGYTYGYYPETMPIRLHWASLIQGHLTPLKNFRYLDAGCGQGYSLILAAASHPNCEFVGIDFLPEHIAHARALASSAGLKNITFIEGDFIELANDPSQLGEFDYAVCHGITTWIAPAVKDGLFRLIGKVLRPGGVFYNSYNTYPGWLGATPFQHLVLLEQRSKVGALALQQARQHMDTLKEHSPGMMNALPGLQSRLKTMESQDPAYLVQEYNNQFWQPVFVSQMMDDMSAVKLSYLGTATLPEAIDAVLPQGVQQLLAQQTSQLLKEQLRDYSLNQSFRRDLYVKGYNRPWPQKLQQLYRDSRFLVNPLTPRPAEGQTYQIRGGAMELNGSAAFYGSVLDLFEGNKDGLNLGEVIDRTEASQRGSVLQAVSLLLHGGWLTLDQGVATNNHAANVNRAVAQSVCDGGPYKYVSIPRAGTAIMLNDVEWQIINLCYRAQGQSKKQGNQFNTTGWEGQIAEGLQRLGRALSKEGRAVTDQAELQSMLRKGIEEFLRGKWGYIQVMGG